METSFGNNWGEPTEPVGCPWLRRACSFFMERFSGQAVCAHWIVKGLILLFLGFHTPCAGPWEAEVCWGSDPAAVSQLVHTGRAVHQLLSGYLWHSESNTPLTQITSMTLTQCLLVPIWLTFWLWFQQTSLQDVIAQTFQPEEAEASP